MNLSGSSRQKPMPAMNTFEIAVFLSSRGISQAGLDAVKDNGVNGGMLLEFCEEDVKDVFTIFKDRFLIRKLLREIRSSSENSRSTVNKVGTTGELHRNFDGGKRPNCDKSMGTYIGRNQDEIVPVDIGKRIRISQNDVPSIMLPKSQSHMQQIDLKRRQGQNSVEFMPQIVSVQSGNKAYLQQDMYGEEINDVISSKHDVVNYYQGRQNKVSSSSKITGSEYSNVASTSNHNRVTQLNIMQNVTKMSPKSEAIVIDDEDGSDMTGNVTSSDCVSSAKDSDLALYYGGYRDLDGEGGHSDFLVVSSTINQYTADELLEKKAVRTKPTEAQRLGHILIRNAAQSAKIWNTAPLLKDIPDQQKELFFNFVFAAAPQLRKKPDLVWCRIREALQNRRKYLMDKENGKRYPKSPEGRHQSLEQIVLEASEVVEIDVKPSISPVKT